MFQRRRYDQQRNLGVMLLAYQMMASGPIPPVTLSAIGLQVAVFLGFLPQLALSKTRSMCLIPYRVLQNGEWYRLLAPVIMHGDDMHLYYNMVSLLYKGRKLERHLGSLRFATILGVFTVASTLMTVAVSYVLDGLLNEDYMSQCAVGFSGVPTFLILGNFWTLLLCFFVFTEAYFLDSIACGTACSRGEGIMSQEALSPALLTGRLDLSLFTESQTLVSGGSRNDCFQRF